MERYFEDSLKLLSDIDRDSLNKNIVYQANKLNAGNYNVVQKEIYKNLNSLYNKTRILEEVKDYLITEISSKISDYTESCKALLKEIEESRDAIKDVTFQTLPVHLASTQSHYDRDGLELPATILYNHEILSKSTERRALPYTLQVKTYKKPYKVTEKALENNQPYRAYYILEQPLNDGVIEELSFVFRQPFGINRLSFKAAATEIFNVRLHNKKDTINLTELYYENAIEADKASIKIKTDRHTERIFLCDASRITKSALETLNQEVYKEAVGEKTLTQKELDDLLGITKLKADYEDYLNRVEDWKKRRAQVAETNRKNGYSDSVPNHELTTLPDNLGVNEKNMKGDIENKTIDTRGILPKKEVVEKDGTRERIVYMYDRVDNIFPSAERYRYDYLDPTHERYYEKLNGDNNE